MEKESKKELQAKADDLKKTMGHDKLWYVPANGHWFSKKEAAEAVAKLWNCKVIEY